MGFRLFCPYWKIELSRAVAGQHKDIFKTINTKKSIIVWNTFNHLSIRNIGWKGKGQHQWFDISSSEMSCEDTFFVYCLVQQ